MHRLKMFLSEKNLILMPYPLTNGGDTSANPVHHIENHETTEGRENIS